MLKVRQIKTFNLIRIGYIRVTISGINLKNKFYFYSFFSNLYLDICKSGIIQEIKYKIIFSVYF